MAGHARSQDHLVVTADDFGMARCVNEAVEIAHCEGILTAASLMVGSEAAADAVSRARRLPRLRVGLHLVLVDGEPVLPRSQIPDLVDRSGRLRSDMARLAVASTARPKIRNQFAAEIEAQFAAFRALRLPLDHVNAHRHFHLHPIIARMVLAIGRVYGLRALRVPLEPQGILRLIDGAARSFSPPSIEALFARRLRGMASRAGLLTSDAVFGLRWSGAMTIERLVGVLRHRPRGLVEIYTHPATSDVFSAHAPGYRYRDELTALCDPACRELASRSSRGGFGDASVTTASATRDSFAIGATRVT